MDAYYEEGNRLYREGKIDQAYEQYTEGLDLACSSSMSASSVASDSSSTYFKLLSNRSICAIQLRNYEQALRDINSCLRLDKGNTKALMRRCKVLEYKGDFAKALGDCKIVLDAAKQMNSVSLFSTMMQTYRRLEQSIDKDDKVRKAEGVPAKFVTESQALRLTFVEEPSCIVKAGVSYSVKVSVTNEFGLWQRRQLLYTEGNELRLGQKSISIHCIASCIHGSSNDYSFHCEKVLVGEDGKAELHFHFQTKEKEVHSDDPAASMNVYMLKFSCDTLPNGFDACDIYTLPILVYSNSCSYQNEHGLKDYLGVGKSIGAACIRGINFNEKCIYALESPGYLGIGGKIWDSTYVLLNYLGRPSNMNLIQRKRVMELGSGTGIAGIALASLQPNSLVLTDLPEVVPLMKENIRLNRILIGEYSEGQQLRDCVAEACEYSWGSATLLNQDGDTLEFDTIIASDVIYDPHGYKPLYDSLCYLLGVNNNSCEDGNTKKDDIPLLVLAHRHRHPEDHKFFDMLYSNNDLIVEKIEWKDDIKSHALLSPDIILFHIYRKTGVSDASTASGSWAGFADYVESMGTKVNGGGMNANFEDMLEAQLAKEKMRSEE